VARVPTRTIALHASRLGSGPALILTHGLGSNQAFWYFRIAPRLATQYQVTLYDLRGHGTSEGPDSGYTTRDLAGDLEALMDAEGIESAHLVGHSFGGAVSLHFAALHPARVHSLTLIDSRLHALQPFDSPEDRAFWDGHRERTAARGQAMPPGTPRWLMPMFEELLASTRANQGPGMVPAPKPGEELWDPKRRSSKRWRRLIEETTFLADLRDEAGLTAEVIAGVDVPTLLVYGGQSLLAKSCSALARLLPRAETRMLEGAGHFFPLARPDWVVETIMAFLNSIPERR
jgi:pimeloyl-ACP methyl ester carboxylesterase